MRILLVEDESTLAAQLAQALAQAGYAVDHAADGIDAEHLGTEHPYDTVVLDLGLPRLDGLTVLKRWRQAGNDVPVLILTARDSWVEKVEGIDAGADDYLTKPFSVSELLARIRVSLRHRGTALAAAVTVHALDGLHIDLALHTVQLHGETLHLTPTEFKLLARLVRSAGRVVTHRQLLADVWGPEYTEHVHYLRLYMAQLRAKIEQEPAEPRHLLTETGVGYRLAVD